MIESNSATWIGLLAETHLADVASQYREEATASGIPPVAYLIFALVLIAIAAIVIRSIDRPPRILNTPTGLLHELCREHRIKSSARRLLEQIAIDAELEQPAELFLSIPQFEDAVAKAGKKIAYDKHQRELLGIMRRRLFAG